MLKETFDKGGNVVIPSFAVGRTQEMLYFLRKIKAERLVEGHYDFPVYVDSPLAVEATGIFQKNIYNCFDEEAMELVRKGINPISFPGLKLAITSDESKMINFDDTPKVILSASGMCEAGRIRHHLKHNLWREECTILFVGYQAVGTLGRKLVDGARNVKLFGEDINVGATIMQLPGMSGHADKNGLVRWVSSISGLQHLIVNHGEAATMEDYAQHIREELGLTVDCPYSVATLDLITNEFVNAEPRLAAKTEHESTPYLRLKAATDRLQKLIARSQGLSNKELAQMTDTLNNLCAKWEQ